MEKTEIIKVMEMCYNHIIYAEFEIINMFI